MQRSGLGTREGVRPAGGAAKRTSSRPCIERASGRTYVRTHRRTRIECVVVGDLKSSPMAWALSGLDSSRRKERRSDGATDGAGGAAAAGDG